MQTTMEESESALLSEGSPIPEEKAVPDTKGRKWSSVALKFVYPSLIAIIFALSLSSQLVDKYFVLKESVLTLELPNKAPP